MIKRGFIFLFLLLISGITTAQRNNDVSPYSFFGIGEDFSPKTVAQSSMGGIGVAMKELNYLNFINPAAYADLRYATYGIGGLTSFLTLRESNASQSGNSTSLRYISLAFPIGNKAGFSVGLQPLSSVGYSLLNRQRDADNILVEVNRYFGKGGTSKIYASYGMYLFKGFSMGIEAGYVFGNITNNIINSRSKVDLATKYKQETTVRGSVVKLGIQYKTDLNQDLQLSTGIAMKISNSLTQKGTEKLYNLSFRSSGQEIIGETLYDRSVSFQIESPTKVVAGLGLGKENNWYIGLNSTFQGAFEASTKQLSQDYRYESVVKTSLGGYYIPKINSISSYWKRVTYRAGVRFGKMGLSVNGNSINNNKFTSIRDFGINVGLGLPLPRQMSNVNIGFEYGQKGTTSNNLIKEDYFNIRLGLSLNSLNWFKKRKID